MVLVVNVYIINIYIIFLVATTIKSSYVRKCTFVHNHPEFHKPYVAVVKASSA